MNIPVKKSVLLTGIKPTGILHVGNYAGAVKPLLGQLENHNGKAYCFIADVHALNQIYDGQALAEASYAIAASLLALGFDPEKTTLFRQSAVPQHAELATLLTNVTGKGLMERGHAFKAIVAENEKEGRDRDHGVGMGLFNYPILMAADILLYHSTTVPVGRDQRQHVEFARDIAGSFNARYGDRILTLPQYDAQNPGPEIAGLDGRKMSKSYGNIIPLFAEPAELKKLVGRIVTDSRLPNEPKDPATSTIVQLYSLFASQKDLDDLHDDFTGGRIGYGDAKARLLEAMTETLAPARERYKELLADRPALDRILAAGAEKARAVASQTLATVHKAMGLA